MYMKNGLVHDIIFWRINKGQPMRCLLNLDTEEEGRQWLNDNYRSDAFRNDAGYPDWTRIADTIVEKGLAYWKPLSVKNEILTSVYIE